MINIKELKNEALKFPEQLRSMVEMQKDKMTPEDFIDLIMKLRDKARKMDIKNMEANK